MVFVTTGLGGGTGTGRRAGHRQPRQSAGRAHRRGRHQALQVRGPQARRCRPKPACASSAETRRHDDHDSQRAPARDRRQGDEHVRGVRDGRRRAAAGDSGDLGSHPRARAHQPRLRRRQDDHVAHGPGHHGHGHRQRARIARALAATAAISSPLLEDASRAGRPRRHHQHHRRSRPHARRSQRGVGHHLQRRARRRQHHLRRRRRPEDGRQGQDHGHRDRLRSRARGRVPGGAGRTSSTPVDLSCVHDAPGRRPRSASSPTAAASIVSRRPMVELPGDSRCCRPKARRTMPRRRRRSTCRRSCAGTRADTIGLLGYWAIGVLGNWWRVSAPSGRPAGHPSRAEALRLQYPMTQYPITQYPRFSLPQVQSPVPGSAAAAARQTRRRGRGPGVPCQHPARSARTARGGTLDSRSQARELLSREVGSVRKPHGGRLRVALAFPNTYFVGMSNLGLQTVYRLFNADERVVCERVFLPAKQELAALLARPRAARHDRVADAGARLRRLRVLRLVRVGLHQRRDDAAAGGHASRAPPSGIARDPLVVIGGAVTFVNPEPLAPFADVIAAGEAELLVPALVDAWFADETAATDACWPGSPRARGFYVPSLYDVTYDGPGRVAAHHAASPGSNAPAGRAQGRRQGRGSARSAEHDDLHARHRVRIAPADRGRARLRQPVPVLLGRLQLPARAAVFDRPHPRDRRGRAAARQPRRPRVDRALRPPRHRADPRAARRDGLRHQPGLAAARRPDGADRHACSARAASGRSRSRPRPARIGCAASSTRPSRTSEILDRADLIFRSGIENLKLYYMIGLPTETDEDLVAIRDLTIEMRERMLEHARPRGTVGRIVASVNPLVPKPGTTYQWMPMTDADVIEREDRAAARARRPTSTTSTSTSSPSGIPTTRACCRSAIAASPTSSSAPKRTAATGARPSPTPASTPTRTSIATAAPTPSCRGRSSTAA